MVDIVADFGFLRAHKQLLMRLGVVAAILLVTVVLQAWILPCDCGRSALKLSFGFCVDAIVVAFMVKAVLEDRSVKHYAAVLLGSFIWISALFLH